jgi:hypothetical protein
MAEYIEREALISEIKTAQETLQSDDDLLWELNKKYHSGLAWAHRIVLESPAADVAPKVNDAEGGREGGLGHVVHGRWENNRCTNCGTHKPYDRDVVYWARNYCPNCGAKMDLQGE